MNNTTYTGQIMEIKGYYRNYTINLGNFFPTSKTKIRKLVDFIYEMETDIDTASEYVDDIRGWLTQEITALDDRSFNCEMEITKYHNLGKGNQVWIHLEQFREREYKYLEKQIENLRNNRISIGEEAAKHGWTGTDEVTP